MHLVSALWQVELPLSLPRNYFTRSAYISPSTEFPAKKTSTFPLPLPALNSNDTYNMAASPSLTKQVLAALTSVNYHGFGVKRGGVG
jgi:hypothetical protein